MSRVAWLLIAVIAIVWFILVVTAMDDALAIIGLVVFSSAAIGLAVLVVVVDAALRAGRDLKGDPERRRAD